MERPLAFPNCEHETFEHDFLVRVCRQLNVISARHDTGQVAIRHSVEEVAMMACRRTGRSSSPRLIDVSQRARMLPYHRQPTKPTTCSSVTVTQPATFITCLKVTAVLGLQAAARVHVFQ